MVLKIEKSIFAIEGEPYLIFNRARTKIISDIKVGQSKGLDDMFGKYDNAIYIEGYIDRKGRLIVKRKVEKQDW